MTDDDQADDDQGAELAREMRLELARVSLALAVNLGVLLAIAKRDELTRTYMRIRRFVTHQRRRDFENAQVAIFRREVCAWEHAEMER